MGKHRAGTVSGQSSAVRRAASAAVVTASAGALTLGVAGEAAAVDVPGRATETVNIRSGPNTNTAVVGKAYPGNSLTIHCYVDDNFGTSAPIGVGSGDPGYRKVTWFRLTNHATGATGFSVSDYVQRGGGGTLDPC